MADGVGDIARVGDGGMVAVGVMVGDGMAAAGMAEVWVAMAVSVLPVVGTINTLNIPFFSACGWLTPKARVYCLYMPASPKFHG